VLLKTGSKAPFIEQEDPEAAGSTAGAALALIGS